MWANCKPKDFKKGFKYQAWVGYEWWDVEVGKNGFNKKDFVILCKDIKRIRKLLAR